MLACSENQLSTLKVSQNTKLTQLNCWENKLTSLDLSQNTALATLYCSGNQLTELYLKKNTALTYLDCVSNQIKGEKMLALVNSLPTVKDGKFYAIDTKDSNEGNVLTKQQATIAKTKGWQVYNYNGGSSIAYEGSNETTFDLNSDGSVDVGDVTTLVAAVLSGNAPATFDLNGDGTVDVGDVTLLVGTVLGGGQGSGSTDTGAQTIKVGSVEFKMLPVAGGTFRMGSPDSDTNAQANEKPMHLVTLSDYYIGETEVTQALWLEVMGSNPSNYRGDLQRPVEMVSWNDCQEFITKLNEKTGKTFRLPTEAEWEYAAYGGSKSQGYKYAGSDDLDRVGWYNDNASGTTHPVKGKAANELGLYDMSGNVSEWCSDRYGDYSSSAQTNPTGPATGSQRVFRGGSRNNFARYCRVTCREGLGTTGAASNIGLRLAMSK